MRKIFMCSLCHNGVLGGALYLENDSLTYRTNKLTVDKKYRNLVSSLTKDKKKNKFCERLKKIVDKICLAKENEL